MIRLTVFDVGHGDSLLLEIDNDVNVVVDCNYKRSNSGTYIPVVDYLKKKGTKQINALVITHFHLDHFAGIHEILKFNPQVIYTPPVFNSAAPPQFRAQLKRYKKKIIELAEAASDVDTQTVSDSFAALIAFLARNPMNVEQITGPTQALHIPGVPNNIAVTGLLPLSNIKGIIRQKILNDQFELSDFPELNDSSLAILIEAHGFRLLLAGDSTRNQWFEHIRRYQRGNIHSLDSSYVKASHHGSKENTTSTILKYFYGSNIDKAFIFVSANGRSHPHVEFFKLLEEMRIQPYCTGLSHYCADRFAMEYAEDIPEVMRPFLIYHQQSKPIQCQGDITLTLDQNRGTVRNSTGTPCIYSFR